MGTSQMEVHKGDSQLRRPHPLPAARHAVEV